VSAEQGKKETIFQQFVNRMQRSIVDLPVAMRVTDIGELTDLDTYWRLAYADCSHVQAFAREGLDDPAAAVFFVQPNV
jgi:hypothetical protein